MKLLQFKKSLIKTQEVIIVGPKKDRLNQRQSFDCPIIFVDGGTKYMKKYTAKHTISIGDGDSSLKTMDLKLNTKKDISDFKAALNLLPRNIKIIFLKGLFPPLKEEVYIDYLLANLGEAYQFSQKNLTYIELNEHSYILPKGSHSLHINGNFSLFTLLEQKIKLTGKCQYQIKKKTKMSIMSSQGLSNQGNGVIEIDTERPIIIIERNI